MVTWIKNTKKPVKKATVKKATVNKKNYIILIFWDLILLYKNFIHWTISKILIFSWSIVLGFILTIPLIFIFFIYSLFSDLNMSLLIQWIFSWTAFYDIYANIILYLIILVYFIGFSYSNILLLNLNNWYIEWKNILYKANDYFNVRKIIKFIKLSFLNLLIIIIPFIIFLILIGILILFSGWTDKVNELILSWALNYFSILSLIFAVISW